MVRLRRHKSKDKTDNSDGRRFMYMDHKPRLSLTSTAYHVTSILTNFSEETKTNYYFVFENELSNIYLRLKRKENMLNVE